MKLLEITEKIQLMVSNRDGNAYVVKADDSKCYLVLEADTYHLEPVFNGMKSTDQIEIPEEIFQAFKKFL